MWSFESGCFSLQNAFMVHPCCNMDQYFIPFYSWMLFYRTDIPHLVYSFVRLTFEFFPPFVLRNTLLWTFMYKLLCRHKFLFLLGIYLVVELLGHRVTLCLTLAGTVKLFCKMAAHFVKWLRLYLLSKATLDAKCLKLTFAAAQIVATVGSLPDGILGFSGRN